MPFLLLLAGSSAAQTIAEDEASEVDVPGVATDQQEADAAFPVDLAYDDHWLTATSRDGDYMFRVQHRLQFRFADPFDADPRSQDDLDRESSSFMVRRARLKFGGHAYRPWLVWSAQYDWSQPVLRDFSLTVEKFSWLQVAIGRRKVLWNDERVASSGRQQFVNRSIVNDIFTVDRQQGIQVFGRLFPGTLADLGYHVGVFSGEGVGSRTNDDRNMMYTGRLQWNMFGRELAFSQSDVEYHERPAGNLAVGAAHNIGRCTAFETDARSCRSLPTLRADGTDFPNPATPGEVAPGQYAVKQLFVEFRIKWRGLYAKHEHHFKEVVDRTRPDGDLGRTTNLRGSLSQLGYFPHHLIAPIPASLEIAGRYARVNPVVNTPGNLQTETSGVINWFFDGHSNKLSLELSRLTVDSLALVTGTENRVRLQWDISF